MKDFILMLPLIIAIIVIIPHICGIINTLITSKYVKMKEIELKMLEENRKILELEIQKQKYQLLLLEEENKKLDKVINKT